MTAQDWEPERRERQLDAAEYVIGTMSAVERSAFEDALASSGDARADVRFWERAFGALNASVAPEPVPAVVWERIERALPGVGGASAAEISAPDMTTPAASAVGGAALADPADPVKAGQPGITSGSGEPRMGGEPIPAAANDNLVSRLRASRGRWRFGALAAGLAALALGWVLGNQSIDLDPRSGAFLQARAPEAVVPVQGEGKRYVAVVQADPSQPALVVNVDAATKEVRVRSLGMERPAGKSLEVWYVPEGEKPVSVGLLGEGEIALRDLSASEGDLLAISLEPEGGAPEGVATGPVIYSGKLVEAPE